jgi:hypothetical protein
MVDKLKRSSGNLKNKKKTDVLQFVTTRIVLSLFYTLYKSLLGTLGLLSLLRSSLAVAWQRIPMADVPLPLGSRTVLGLSYQLLTITAHNN